MDALFGEEYQALRESVRALAEKKIAPFARDVDQAARFPQEASDALYGADLAAAHVSEKYGGQGADALATAKDSRIAYLNLKQDPMLLR